jgi:hypothetical protein
LIFSLSIFFIASNCLKNFIYDASKHCSSLFFSTQASLPNFSAALAILYADDQILMATSEDDLQTMAYHLKLIARKYKMEDNNHT